MVKKKTASCGCAGQIARVKPSIHAPVPIALATKEAFRVFIGALVAQYAFDLLMFTAKSLVRCLAITVGVVIADASSTDPNEWDPPSSKSRT